MKSSPVKKFGFGVLATVFTMGLALPASAGTCYNPVPDRDKWLTGWVTWIPAKGQKVDLRGTTYTQNSAIKFAHKDIPKGYQSRGGDVTQSPAGMSALAMIKAKNNEAKAMKAYARLKMKETWENASACWK